MLNKTSSSFKYLPKGRVEKHEMLRAVKQHAIECYDAGWDLVVECMDDIEIATIIEWASTCRGAIAMMAAHIAPRIAYRREIEATAF